MSTEGEEVAEDYRHALEDLSSNARFEISNLTVIARENTEHALLIAEVLEKHILKTAPSKKLPALYVLDSIVKNVGTPYTLYLGRNLFKTFMEAYTVVDNSTRKRMEEMLKTWKQPVAGSMDTRPVFSPDLVRPIENALMKAKAAMMPQAQLPGRPRPAIPPYRNTPTPPGMRSAGGTPNNLIPPPHAYPPGTQPPNGQMQYPTQPHGYPQHSTPQPVSSTTAPFQPPLPGAYGLPGAPVLAQPAGVNVEMLSSDIQNMIVAMRPEASQNPHDTSVQTKLRALLDLQRIVQSQSLPQDQLELIKNEVTRLSGVTLGAPLTQNPSPAIKNTPPPQQQLVPPPVQPARSSVTPTPAPPSAGQGPVTLDSLLGAGALAALMGRTSSQHSTPNPPPPAAVVRSPQPAQAAPYAAPPAPAPNASSLLDQLRQAGLIPSTTPTNAGAVAPPPPSIPPNIASLLSGQKPSPAGWAGFNAPIRGGLDSALLKQPARPDVISQLYEQLGPPCTQCGRRFKTDAEGKRKKTAHMDWHFRVNQRGTEAEKRGTHRSYYLDSQDWLKSREAIDADHMAVSEDNAAQATKAAAEAAKPKYIPVPEPGSRINNVCPICQDRFENKWLDTAQEWVWLDTVLVGGRAYHASCHAEAARDREGTPRRTPEPVLGKRKAENGLSSPKVRSLKTFA